MENLESLNLQDLMFAKALGVSEKEVKEMDLFQTMRKMQNRFDKMLFQWKDGNKPDLTLEEAQELDKKYRNIIAELECNHDHNYMASAVVRFSAIPKNEYSVALYSGIPSLMDWASEMLSATV